LKQAAHSTILIHGDIVGDILEKRVMPIGVQTFDKIIEDKNVYVDKTRYVYRLVSTNTSYFLARPRRFGKSLFVSTLKAYFLGKRELFNGLAIAELEKEWAEYPVIHIDLTAGLYDSRKGLEDVLEDALRNHENIWGKDDREVSLPVRFAALIRRAHEQSGKKVVVLVDEYDKPMLHSLEKGKEHEEIKTELKVFYSVLKSQDQYLRFVFFAGVTKFSKISVFSDLNQLNDIGMTDEYAAVCGITEPELLENFKPELASLAEKHAWTFEKTLAEMRKNYNGYRFSKQGKKVYNPFSVLNAFSKKDIDYYWYGTGTPSFLIKELQRNKFDIPKLTAGVDVDAQSISDYRSGGENVEALLYQSGYLTILEYNEQRRLYRLGFPNEEVKYGFLRELLPAYVPVIKPGQAFYIGYFLDDLAEKNINGVMERLISFFASIPYDIASGFGKEQQYQTVFYLVFTLLGQLTGAEVRGSRGRCDAVVKTDKYIFVFEFKLNTDSGKTWTAREALKQIDDKGYLIPYRADGREVIKIGVVFDNEKRNIGEWELG
jgi:hypothetical protein